MEAHIKALLELRIYQSIKHNEYHLCYSDFLDEDGYPTDEALAIIEHWGWWSGYPELMKFIEGLWSFKEFGWHKIEHKEDGESVIEYQISTAGWSGNESLIYALQENKWHAWSMIWVQSRRGGHYIFEIKD